MNVRLALRLALFATAWFIIGPLHISGQETRPESRQEPDAEPEEKWVGEWKVEKGMKAGEASPDENIAMTITIKPDTITIPSGGEEPFTIAWTVDTSKDPAHVDLKITGGPAVETDAPGIMAFEGEKLKICYNPNGSERPAEFESTADNGFHLFVLVRGTEKLTAEKLYGKWAYVSGKRAGEDIPAERLSAVVEVDSDAFTVPSGMAEPFVMAWKLDASQSPAAIDFSITSGPATGGTAKGIVRLERDHFVLCYDPMGQTRPEEFESTAENGFFLFELKRSDQ
jgi:uncharacterized protein (TIGR03067 family)